MRFWLAVLLIALLSAAVEYFLPWWSVAVVCLVVSLFVTQTGGRAFWMGFLGVGIFWLVMVLLRDIPNEHILSTRMAALFHLPGHWAFILVTVLIGALVGGLSSLLGALMRLMKG